jgi:hypothetical protein
VSRYSERLGHLKKELSVIKGRKNKGFSKNQKIMFLFINGITDTATFLIKDMTIILKTGNEYKGFMHILLKHYRNGDLEAMDILNLAEVAQRGIVLSNEGVSNDKNTVYMLLKSNKDLRLILNPDNNGNFVISMYRKGS